MKGRKIISFVFLWVFLISKTTSALEQEQTRIVIIGNIHDSVPNYHPQILLDILEKVKPDIILHEVDSAMSLDYFGTAPGKENEINASNRYLQAQPGTQRGTFDFEGRNSYRRNKGMVPTDSKAMKLLDSLYDKGLLTADEKTIYEDFRNITAQLMNIAEQSPDNFNNAGTDSICRLRQNMQHQALLKIINSREEFITHTLIKPDGQIITYRQGYALWAQFWDLRNQTMAKNIRKHALQNPGKTIVVLTGFLHRYYLIEELKKYKNSNIVLKEFYE